MPAKYTKDCKSVSRVRTRSNFGRLGDAPKNNNNVLFKLTARKEFPLQAGQTRPAFLDTVQRVDSTDCELRRLSNDSLETKNGKIKYKQLLLLIKLFFLPAKWLPDLSLRQDFTMDATGSAIA